MNKSDLIDAVAKVVDTKKAAQEAVDTVFSSIIRELKNGAPVAITGFGTFKAYKRPARMGRNPKTGAALEIKAKIVPKFIPGKALKNALN